MAKNNKRKEKGIKHDSGKPDLTMLPYEALVEVSRALMYGEQLYGHRNWQNGISYRRLLAASLRHIYKYLSMIDNDEESKVHHLGHAICNLMFILWQEKNKKEMDDR